MNEGWGSGWCGEEGGINTWDVIRREGSGWKGRRIRLDSRATHS